MYTDILKVNKWYCLLFISCLTIFFTYFIQSAFVSVNVFFNTYSQTLTYERVQELFATAKKYEIVTYSLCLLYTSDAADE